MVRSDELFHLPNGIEKIVPQAMECVLSEVKPSLVLNPRALWSEKANQTLRKHTQDTILHAKV